MKRFGRGTKDLPFFASSGILTLPVISTCFTKLIQPKKLMVHDEELISVLSIFNREFGAIKAFASSAAMADESQKILRPSSLRSPIKVVFLLIEQIVLY